MTMFPWCFEVGSHSSSLDSVTEMPFSYNYYSLVELFIELLADDKTL